MHTTNSLGTVTIQRQDCSTKSACTYLPAAPQQSSEPPPSRRPGLRSAPPAAAAARRGRQDARSPPPGSSAGPPAPPRTAHPSPARPSASACQPRSRMRITTRAGSSAGPPGFEVGMTIVFQKKQNALFSLRILLQICNGKAPWSSLSFCLCVWEQSSVEHYLQ